MTWRSTLPTRFAWVLLVPILTVLRPWPPLVLAPAYAQGPIDLTEMWPNDALDETASIARGDMDGDGELEFNRGYWISTAATITPYLKGESAEHTAESNSLHSPPATYYGQVHAGTGFAPTPGMAVTAWVSGSQCGQSSTIEIDREIVYSVNVFADGPGGLPGCGTPGREVSFRIGETTMLPTTLWNNSQVWNLPLSPPSCVIINEMDADTPGTDSIEFIELYDGGSGHTSLDGLVLVFYNGSGDVSYKAIDLDGYSTDANGYFVAGNAGVANVDLVFGDHTLQNGADAAALYVGNATAFPAGTPVTTAGLLDALVYDTSDADDTGLLVLLNSGQAQVNEAGGGDKDSHSNQRYPNGTGGQRNTGSYVQADPTPGRDNQGPRPDLVLTQIEWTPSSPSEGNEIRFSVHVRNDGRADTSAWGRTRVHLSIADQAIGDAYVDNVAPGTTEVLNFDWTATQGNHQVQAMADYGDSIPESDEENNERTVQVSVQTQDGIYLYEHSNYGGRYWKWTEDDADFRDEGANDVISSICFVGSYAGGKYVTTLYEHINYGGAWTAYGASDSNLSDDAIGNDRASSIRIQAVPQCTGDGIYLYEHPNYGGRCQRFTGSDADLRDTGFDDLASSVKLVGSYGERAYRVVLCENVNYGGTCSSYTTNDNDLGNDAIGHDKTSSIQIALNPTYSSSGQVLDGTGAPIPGVRVSAGSGLSVTTGANGTFSLVSLYANVYTLTPSKEGWTFTPASRTVNVPPNATGQDFIGARESESSLVYLPVVLQSYHR